MKGEFENGFYERNLPHYQPTDATYSVVFRLAGSLPIEVVRELRRERDRGRERIEKGEERTLPHDLTRQRAGNLLGKFDRLLDMGTTGPRWLARPNVANVVAETLHYWDSKVYELLAYCIMPNHVHLVFSVGAASRKLLSEPPMKGPTRFVVTNILSSIKKFSARKANGLLGRSGAFWQAESYDHVIRDGTELEAAIWYVLLNPVSAGLVDEWKNWRWWYVAPGLVEI